MSLTDRKRPPRCDPLIDARQGIMIPAELGLATIHRCCDPRRRASHELLDSHRGNMRSDFSIHGSGRVPGNRRLFSGAHAACTGRRNRASTPGPGERLGRRLLELGWSQIRLGTRAVRRTAVPGGRLGRRQVGAAWSEMGVGERTLGSEMRERCDRANEEENVNG